ncbi:hypothetical protein HSB1_06780 [Halogranum salarium B-1]|uniref:Uncharacterized protein n=1 Tax=Halogranum salarium B-1 TaxID=1210908 RepID=J2ZH90_9EURY|nr:hypothetical protein HSB1_06780 [Halogranum salarium B-1]
MLLRPFCRKRHCQRRRPESLDFPRFHATSYRTSDLNLDYMPIIRRMIFV